MTRRRKLPRRRKPSMTARRGRPRQGEAFADTILRVEIRTIHQALGGRAEAPGVFDEAARRNKFR